MKKMVISLLLALILLLVGCGGDGGQGNIDDTTVASGPKKITIGIPTSALVLDYNTNAYTLWLEEVSGYDIEIISYSSSPADYSQQLATDTAAGNELPDILWRFQIGDDLIEKYGEDGYFIDLSEYYADREKSANFWRMFEEYLSEEERDRVWRLIHAENRDAEEGEEDLEGAIYVYPSVETTLIDTMDFMPLINQKWLDALHLQAPTTLDELVAVLRAFKTGDPNGNQVADEIPMLGPTGGLGSDTINWLVNFFIYHDDTYYFNIDENGQLYYPQMDDRYKEALRFIRGLVQEGLLNTNVLSYGYDRMRSVLMNTDMVGVTVIHPSLGFSMESDRILNWSALNLYGDVYYNSNQFYRDVFITEDCEDPDAAWDLLMTMCCEESAIRLRYGEKGVHWDWADEGAISVMGIPATIKVTNDIWGSTNNSSWMNLAGGIYPYTENEQNQPTGMETPQLLHKYELYQDLRANYDAALAKVDQSQVCPYLRFNEDEDEIAKSRVDMKKEQKAWRNNFINGTRDIDADWDDYIKAMEEAGSKQYRDAAQMCYERMYKSGT